MDAPVHLSERCRGCLPRAGVLLSDDPALSASPTAAQLYDLRPPPEGVPYRRAGRNPAARSEPADPFPSGF